jgi:hypothetical protein
MPQLPQFAVAVEVSVSQPLVELPSQLLNVPEQPVNVHTPLAQATPVALTSVFVQLTRLPQVVPQAVSVFRLASQPFDAVASQSPNPELQVKLQLPAMQPIALAFCTDVEQLTTLTQAVPQVVVAFRLVSQPFVAFESQLAKPELQLNVHAPAAQPIEVAFCTVDGQLTRLPQVVPHAAVTFKLVSQPFDAIESQLPKPELQVKVQVPAAQPIVVAF